MAHTFSQPEEEKEKVPAGPMEILVVKVASGLLCQEETEEVINAPHFLLFSPYPARISPWPNANRSQKLKI